MAESNFDANAQLYEYDAPSQVVDLKELQNAEYDDRWFEQQETSADEHPLWTPLRSTPALARGAAVNLPTAVVCPQAKAGADEGPSSSVPEVDNIVTSWGDAAGNPTVSRPNRRTANSSSAQPGRVVKRKQLTNVPAAPPPKKQKSSEEKELDRIKTLQKEVALHRRKNEASYRAALAGKPAPEKTVLSVTMPKEFHFSTKPPKGSASSSTSQKESDVLPQHRKPPTPTKTVRGATVPKPFNLSRCTKRRTEETSSFVPMAQLIEQFQKRTPERYHLRSRKEQVRGPSPVKGEHLKLTQPVTPHLVTKQRSRPPTAKGQAELEAEELDRLQSYKFRALELNRKIMEGAEALKKPPAKEPTVPEGFELQIEKRLQKRQADKAREDDKPHQFKSHPLPRKILQGVIGLPEKKVQPPTMPESPAFVLKKRLHREPEVEEVKPAPPFKAPPVPHFGLPFHPHLPEDRHVEVCPFSFEEREQDRRVLKEKKLEEKRLEEAQVPQFKAQPLPDFDTVVLPEKKKLEATKPEPFRLLVDQRGAVKSTRLERMVKEEQKQLKQSTVFKAKPNVVTHKEPFQPKKESRPAVVLEAFQLSTERRARERQEFERAAVEKEVMRAMMEEEQKREEEQREREEIARLRQEQVHKAQPIRHYKPLAQKKSELPLTIPQSPNFCDRFRL